MVVADAAGTAASVAAMTHAKSESLNLFSHTTVPPLLLLLEVTSTGASGDCQNLTKIVQASLGNNTASTVMHSIEQASAQRP
jgi:hypothetical protein